MQHRPWIIFVASAIATCGTPLTLSCAHAADPAEAVPTGVPGPAAGEELQKTKTRSNQSNDRTKPSTATPSSQPPAVDVAESAAVVKTKTKSNQSNDRLGTAPEPAPEAPASGEDPAPAAVVKTKTKSNQSND